MNLIKAFNKAIDIIVNNRNIRYILINQDTLEINTFDCYYDYLLYIMHSKGSYIYLDFRLSKEHTKIVNGNFRQYKSPSIGLISIHAN